MLKVELPYQIPFHDVDSMSIVWHGRYVKYFEIVRCKLLDKMDYGYKAMCASGYSWPVIDMRVKYIRPLFFEQDVILEAELKEWEYRIKIEYRIMDLNSGEVTTKGHTSQVAVDLASGEKCFESPALLEEKLKKLNLL